jgi:hypothetical protein
MIDRDEARKIALDFIAPKSNAKAPERVLLDDKTIERPFGWVFFYEARKFLDSHNIVDKLIGNSPFIVDRKDGSVHVMGTRRPIEFYLDAYENTGKLPERPAQWQRAPKRSGS